jgi:hypothetical protein
MTLRLPALALLTLLAGHTDQAFAFGNSEAKVLLHLTAPLSPGSCTSPSTAPGCDQVDTSGDLYPALYFAHVLIADGSASEGIAGVHYGIEYDGGATGGAGIDVFGWTICATIELAWPGPLGPHPASGSSNLISWDSLNRCQRNEPGGPGTGVVAHVGYYYCAAYSASQMRIIPGVRGGNAIALNDKVVVSSCAGQSDIIEDRNAPHVPSPLGSVAFSAGGQTNGTNPCVKVVSIAPTTWSALKGTRAGD